MNNKFLGIRSLALLQLIIVGNLQILPANAVYGFSLPILYLLAAIGFFIPSILMTAELATTRPQTGGAYIWVQQAFGNNVGFFTVAILWLSNLLWYPSIFALIATNAAYLINPVLAQSKLFIISFSASAFWLITVLNCCGIKISFRLSAFCAVVGILFPMILIITGGTSWWLSGHPLAITTHDTPWLPDLRHLTGLGFLIAIAVSLFGMEVPAVHAGNVDNPRRDFPISLFISGALLLILLLGAELAIAIIIPPAKLNVVSGLLDALTLFLVTMHWQHALIWVLILVFLGNLGSVAAWMLGSTRAMFVACKNNHISGLMQKINDKEAPVGVLLCEAFIFTLACGIFLLFPTITDSFWLLLDVASQISLIYYVVLFIAAIRLRYLPCQAVGFIVPGGHLVFAILMGLGILTSSTAFLLGIIPPPGLSQHDILIFHTLMLSGLSLAVILPLILLKRARS